jgi:DNA-binding MarR family transcriptional regulator
MKESSENRRLSAARKKRQPRNVARGAKTDAIEFPEPGECNFTALRKAMRRISQLYDAAFAPCGLRATQWSILVHVGQAGQPTHGQLADSLALDRSALAHNLKPLERDGLVVSLSNQGDKRSRLVMLTPAGRIKVAESLKLWEEAQQNVELIFGARNAKSLRDSLEILASKAFSHAFEELHQKDHRPPE